MNPYAFLRLASEGADDWEELYVAGREDSRADGKAFKDCWHDEDRDFCLSVLNDTVPPVTGYDGKQAVAMCLAAYRSGQTGEIVRLPM